MKTEWLDIKGLSLYFNIKEKTLYYLVARGQIPHYRIGKIIRFKKCDIDFWIEGKKAKSMKKHLDKIIRSVYTTPEGKPDMHLERR
ncbi:MAG: hypothetical protein A2073_03645 [Deltaproteobacteria bacterium GWC2_42_11]|nr:MAG: hypothetical protein A2073_03645 [Deltaproteobacteria bacterium GWC2_42_11]HBO84013.1 hypothetical protein [Deltaproteobacteria bacterium]